MPVVLSGQIKYKSSHDYRQLVASETLNQICDMLKPVSRIMFNSGDSVMHWLSLLPTCRDLLAN